MKVTRTSVFDLIFGKPLATADASHQAISKRVGLAVFASDAMSSIAYATQEILLVLALVGTSAFVLSIPISLVIVGLLIVLTLSYRQTIFAYPNGGGAYIVAKDNLGNTAGMVAAAALLTDYVLTVAVSVSNGVEQIASAIPALVNYRWELASLLVVVMTLINMRGVKESGTVFAIPTYFFLVTVTLTLVSGLIQWLNGSLATVTGVQAAHHAVENLSLLIILRAFSNGCTALTGVEAISNGVLSFKEPRGKNAANTLLVMSIILGSSFLGITLIAQAVQVVPAEFPTVISQIGSAVFGNTLGYFMLIAGAAIILIMAANTSFNAFPLLSAQVAADGFIPRWFTNRGNKLTYNTGIGVLALAAIALIVIFDARVTRLIPLYAIGVFMSFTLSQAGMVARWTRAGRLKKGETMRTSASAQVHDPHWQGKRLLNLVGGHHVRRCGGRVRHHQVQRRRLDHYHCHPRSRLHFPSHPRALPECRPDPKHQVRDGAADHPPNADHHPGRRRASRHPSTRRICQVDRPSLARRPYRHQSDQGRHSSTQVARTHRRGRAAHRGIALPPPD
ncbi:MAG: APC family permease [Anaerolineae bacterium]|nr:APC family permease [Anaerolineae bacterium]